MSGSDLTLALFAVGIAGLYGLPLLHRELMAPGFGTGIVLLGLGLVFVALALSGLLLLIRHRDRQPRWALWGAVGLVALWVPAFASGALVGLGDRLYFERREAGLRALAERVERYGITEMSDGQRFFKSVNGILYRGPGRNPSGAISLDAALDSAGVSRAAYDDVRRRLIAVEMISVARVEGRTVFVIDGFLDNVSGVLHAPDGPPPALGDLTPDGRIVALTRVGDGWWLYATT